MKKRPVDLRQGRSQEVRRASRVITRRNFLGMALVTPFIPGMAVARKLIKGSRGAVEMLWSDPDTWGGAVPVDTQAVTIPTGVIVRQDVDTASLGALTVDGRLYANSGSLTLKAASVQVNNGGEFFIGASEGSPFVGTYNLFLTGDYTAPTIDSSNTVNTNAQVSRVVNVAAGGKFYVYGQRAGGASTLMTKLNATANIGATSLTFADTVNWPSGSRIAIAPTQYYSATGTEFRTLSGATSGTSASITVAIAAQKYGVMQYATGAGMSLTNDGFNAGNVSLATAQASGFTTVADCVTWINALIAAGMRTELDERAEVVNLDSNVTIAGGVDASDTAWTTYGHGVSLKKMGNTGSMRLVGVRMDRCGQRGILGGYPMHWHLNSYDIGGTNAFTANVSGDCVKKCVIENSTNRAVALHAVRGVTLEDTYAVNILGHAFFLEDGAEQENTFLRCGALMVRKPTGGHPLATNAANATTFSTDGTGNITRTQTHGLVANQPVSFRSTGSLPPEITPGQIYYVSASGLTTTVHRISATPGGAVITFSSASTGLVIPSYAHMLKYHDDDPSGFWLVNPKNPVSYCWAADCQGNGIWSSFSSRCWGLSGSVAIKPYVLSHSGFHHNSAHSCNRPGIRTSGHVSNEVGNVTLNGGGFDGQGKWRPTIDESENSAADIVRQTFSDITIWKCGGNNIPTNGGGGYHDLVSTMDLESWVVADNAGQDFAGTSWDLIVNNCLGVATSLNTSGVAYPGGTQVRNFMASYHSTARVKDSLCIGYGYQTPVQAQSTKTKAGGVIDSGDYYLPGGHIEKGNSRNTGLVLLNSFYMGKSLSARYDGFGDYQESQSTVVTFTAGTTTCNWTAHGKSVGNRIGFDNLTGSLPPELEVGITYRVQSVINANSITVEPLSTSGAITFSTAGSGTNRAFLATKTRRFGLSGAVWDPNGYDGLTPGNWRIPNKTFFTSGAASLVTVGSDPNQRATTTKFFGVGSFRSNKEWDRINAAGLSGITSGPGGNTPVRVPMLVERWSDTAGTVIDTYEIRDGLWTDGLAGFIGFSAQASGIYRVQFPGMELPDEVSAASISNAWDSGDNLLLALPWSTTVTPTGVYVMSGSFSNQTTYVPTAQELSDGKARHVNVAGASVAAVLADASGLTHFHDTARGCVWLLHKGGLTANVDAEANTTVPGDNMLYRGYGVSVTA